MLVFILCQSQTIAFKRSVLQINPQYSVSKQEEFCNQRNCVFKRNNYCIKLNNFVSTDQTGYCYICHNFKY